jgi:hypothetical protein
MNTITFLIILAVAGMYFAMMAPKIEAQVTITLAP